MADIRAWAKAHAGPVLELSDAVRTSLGLFIDRLRNGSTCHVPCQVADHVVHVFTDGSSEAEDHLIGGVIMVHGTLVSYFGCVVPDTLVSKWAGSMKHWIGPIEAYAVAVARKAWHQYLAGRMCIFCIDNIPAQDAYVRGTSANVHVREILLAFEHTEGLCASWPWFALVASQSNIADDPSRADFTLLRRVGCVRVSPSCPISGCDLWDLRAPARVPK